MSRIIMTGPGMSRGNYCFSAHQKREDGSIISKELTKEELDALICGKDPDCPYTYRLVGKLDGYPIDTRINLYLVADSRDPECQPSWWGMLREAAKSLHSPPLPKAFPCEQRLPDPWYRDHRLSRAYASPWSHWIHASTPIGDELPIPAGWSLCVSGAHKRGVARHQAMNLYIDAGGDPPWEKKV